MQAHCPEQGAKAVAPAQPSVPTRLHTGTTSYSPRRAGCPVCLSAWPAPAVRCLGAIHGSAKFCPRSILSTTPPTKQGMQHTHFTQIYFSECLRPLTPRTACPGQVTVDTFEQTLKAFAILCAAFFHFRRVTLQVVEQRDAYPPRQPPLFQY